MPPLVSVLMSVYNGMPFLAATLASILGQTYTHFELIVIDDGSRDDTWEVLGRAAAQDARMRLLRNEHNQGVSSAMNRLFQLARGELIVRHDADDLSHPNRFAIQVAFLEQNPLIGVLGTRVQTIDIDGQLLQRLLFKDVFGNDEIQAELLRKNCLCQGSVMFRRHLLETVGGYEEDNVGSEDYDLWLRMAEVSQIVILKETLYQYRLHSASLSHRRRPEQIFYAARAIERAVRRRFGPKPPVEYFQPAAQTYLHAALGSFAAGSEVAACQWLAHSLEIYPSVLDLHEWLGTLITDYAAHRTPEAGLELITQVFARLLPRQPRLKRLRAQLLSDLHMRQVFAAAKVGSSRQVDEHLWPGIRLNPAWLKNRGVLVLLARSTLRRSRAIVASADRR